MISANMSGSDEIEIKVPCKPEYVRTIRRIIADFAQNHDMPQSAIEEIEIAASEAVTNIVRHAYTDHKRIQRVRVKCARRRYGMLLEIMDRGRGFNAPEDDIIPHVDLDLERDGGYGILLIKCLMDKVNYISRPDEGTKIKMTKAVHGIPTVKRIC